MESKKKMKIKENWPAECYVTFLLFRMSFFYFVFLRDREIFIEIDEKLRKDTDLKLDDKSNRNAGSNFIQKNILRVLFIIALN